LPIIALTANALAEDRQKCLDAGMDDFVSKPFRKEDLIEVVRHVTGERGDATPAVPPADPVSAETAKADSDVATASAVAVATEPAIDKRSLDQINELDPSQNGELLNRIIDIYCENAEVLILELIQAAKDEDIDGAVRAAHSLKSSSANVGAQRLAALCRSMEQHGRKGDISAILRHLDPAWNEYQVAVDELAANKTEVAA
jgi:HPt (histidine-containing phosphotransfer) domain-containing protein